MPAHVDDVAVVGLKMILLMIIYFIFKFRLRRAAAMAPAALDEEIPLPVSGYSQDVPFAVATDRGGDLIAWSTDGPGEWRTQTQQVTCKPYAIVVDGLQGEAQMEVFFILKCTRSEGHTEVLLKVDQMDFGIKTCCKRDCCLENRSCERNCDEFFIKKVRIEVRPDAWAQECQRLVLEPHVTPEEYQLQHSSTYGFQLPVVCPRQAFITYQAGNILSRRAASFGWGPASRDSCNSVTWNWELSRFADGTSIRFNKFNLGSRPQLGFQPASVQIHPGLKASWHLPYNADLQVARPVWDTTIISETAVIKKKNCLPVHFVTKGPSLTHNQRLAI